MAREASNDKNERAGRTSMHAAMSADQRSSTEPHDVLMCDVCLEAYDDRAQEAKFLTCHHSFCITCLTTVAKNTPHIECPTCRAITPLPEGGVPALQTNFYITHIRETFNKLGMPKLKGCKKHSNQPMSFFCKKCGIAICRDCTVLDHKESEGHGIQDITVAEVEQRQALVNKQTDANKALDTLQQDMQHLEAETGNLTVAKEIALKELDDVFDHCKKMLEFRKMQLTKSVFDQYNKKQELLLAKRNTLTSGMKNLTNLISQCDQLLKSGQLVDVVGVTRNIENSIDDVTTESSKMNLGTNYLRVDSQLGVKAFEESICQLGQVLSTEFLPTDAKFSVQKAVAGLKSVVTLEVFSHTQKRLPKYPITVTVKDPTSAHLINTISANESGGYIITFVPQLSGEHRLAVAFLGHTIQGADVKLMVESNNPVEKYGDHGHGNGKYLSPRAIALDSDGSLFVADTGNKLIQKLDSNGEFISQFAINNNKENCSTCDLALNVEQGLIVCTETMIGTSINPTMGNNVLVFNREGEIQDVFCNKIMKCALCIATNSRGDIIVSDYLVHTLFMYDAKGNFMRRIGHAGTFNHPAFICIGKDDSIIVSDTNNDCVQIFDKDGNFLHQFGTSGSGKGQLKQPFGVATDGEHILVVDSGNRRIQVFTEDGTFVSIIESKKDKLDQPRGIALTEDGFVYVADRDNHCIKKFKYK